MKIDVSEGQLPLVGCRLASWASRPGLWRIQAVRNASEYDVFIPLKDNQGESIDPEWIARLKKRLHDRFGGLTFFPQSSEGIWRVGNVTFRDDIVIIRVLSEEVRESREFFQQLKQELEEELEQHAVLIVERKVEVL